MPPRPLRKSCDRCHTQKLKCARAPGFAACARCSKAGTPCVSSPAGPPARRSPTPAYASDFSLQAALLDDSIDWGYLTAAATSSNPATPSNVPQPSRQDPTPNPAPPPPPPPDSRSACVALLTALAVEADQLHERLPSASAVHVPAGASVERVYGLLGCEARQFVEQLFEVGQQLIDLYPRVLRLITESPHLDDCEDPACFHHISDPPGYALVDQWVEEPAGQVDPFLVNLLISCHASVSDTIGNLLTHAKACFKYIHTSGPDHEKAGVDVPEVRVGTFVASASSSSSMQAVLLAHIAAVLAECAAQLSKKVAEHTADGCDAPQNQIYHLQCKLLEDKARSRATQLQHFRDAMTKIGFQS